jgi:cholesterol oxidase
MDNEFFDAVVIGSGFGGSVMAYRLAEAGLRVCLLERGKAYPPNSFARAPYDLGRNFWDPSKGLYGMFDIWSFKGAGALVSSGLGGGSLIYANILLRKDPQWFINDNFAKGSYESWPVTYEDLECHYERVEKMMNVQKYPLKYEPYKNTPKTLAMLEADQKLGQTKGFDPSWTHKWMPLNLAVSFRSKPVNNADEDDPNNPPIVGAQLHEDYPNYHTVINKREMPRSTCRLCGECDMGCNYGSKNTLDYTYITAAIHQPCPAVIKTLCEVKAITPLESKGYAVDYVQHDSSREGQKIKTDALRKERITCRHLIISAGTFGSPYLLLRNRSAFPRLSQKLGSHFCVNGDLLSFLIKSIERKKGKSAPRRLDPSFGPVITSAIRIGDTLDDERNQQGRGFYVEDGGNPYLLSWLSEVSGFPGFLRRTLHFLKIIVKYRLGLNNDADLSAEIADLVGPANTSKSSFPLLTMGRDIPNGNLYLKGDRLECDWKIKKSQEYFDRVIRVNKVIARALNAEYMDNPSYKWNFHQVISAHPLGGCPMGRDEREGVVNEFGEVFNYPNLYIADGSILPGPVGANPSLTIAALSDRIADRILSKVQKPVRRSEDEC